MGDDDAEGAVLVYGINLLVASLLLSYLLVCVARARRMVAERWLTRRSTLSRVAGGCADRTCDEQVVPVVAHGRSQRDGSGR